MLYLNKTLALYAGSQVTTSNQPECFIQHWVAMLL